MNVAMPTPVTWNTVNTDGAKTRQRTKSFSVQMDEC